MAEVNDQFVTRVEAPDERLLRSSFQTVVTVMAH